MCQILYLRLLACQLDGGCGAHGMRAKGTKDEVSNKKSGADFWIHIKGLSPLSFDMYVNLFASSILLSIYYHRGDGVMIVPAIICCCLLMQMGKLA